MNISEPQDMPPHHPDSPDRRADPSARVEPTQDIQALERAAEHYAEQARAEGTVQRYRQHWEAFVTWCEANGLCALPAAPATVAM